jgi:spore coat protein CotH
MPSKKNLNDNRTSLLIGDSQLEGSVQLEVKSEGQDSSDSSEDSDEMKELVTPIKTSTAKKVKKQMTKIVEVSEYSRSHVSQNQSSGGEQTNTQKPKIF